MVISIALPKYHHEVLVKKGQFVDFQTPLYKIAQSSEVVIPLASKIKIPPQNIFVHLKKVIGDEVKKGELIAAKKSFISTVEYYSEHDGIIKEIDHEEGYLVLNALSEKEQTTLSFFRGEIESVEATELLVKLGKGYKFDLQSATVSFGGKVVILNEKNEGDLKEDEVELKVAIAKKIPGYEQAKLEALGIDGFVTIQPIPDLSSETAWAQLKNESDWEKIKNIKLQYCIVDKGKAIIYFYH